MLIPMIFSTGGGGGGTPTYTASDITVTRTITTPASSWQAVTAEVPHTDNDLTVCIMNFSGQPNLPWVRIYKGGYDSLFQNIVFDNRNDLDDLGITIYDSANIQLNSSNIVRFACTPNRGTMYATVLNVHIS